ncbi:COG4315 family predicted lipoprotein [Streptomyces chartreusis]|uniref:COG4315 family predicted lipoprotein n=1 Tax=Streptomyces chartreusis TaxID=1969 RepID=UPI0036B4C4D5
MRTVLLASPLLLVLAACGSSSDGGDAPGKPPISIAQGQAAKVRVAESDLGPILVDASGRTLYAFTKDKEGQSNCDESCIAVWPALSGKTRAEAGNGVDKALLKGLRQAEGSVQTSYGDWPLYYYVGDAVAGDVNGQGLDGEWFVIDGRGKLVRKTS